MPEYAANHTINQETGMMESKAWISSFDSPRKLKFLETFKANGMGLYRTCRAMGLSTETVNKHYHIDPVFRALYDEAKIEYSDELESVSRVNALNPKSVIERIFQLKALFPSKYGDTKTGQNLNISINLDPQMLSSIKGRQGVIEVEEISPSSGSIEPTV